MEYDPLLAKLAVWAPDRPAALARLNRALGETYVAGIRANVPLFQAICADAEFAAGNLDTSFLDGLFRRRADAEIPPHVLEAAQAAAQTHAQKSQVSLPSASGFSAWRDENRRALFR
jgi:acetyl/propionyl-CoA carboxylase alpha subunit